MLKIELFLTWAYSSPDLSVPRLDKHSFFKYRYLQQELIARTFSSALRLPLSALLSRL